MLKWKERLESVTSAIRGARASSSEGNLVALPPPQGWALRGPNKAKHHSQAVKMYLHELFEKGQRTGRKSEPSDVARDLKSAKTADGTKRFQPDDWLSASRVASYFSRLAAALRIQSEASAVTESEDSHAMAASHDQERQEFRNNVLRSFRE